MIAENIACIFVFFNPPAYSVKTLKNLSDYGYRVVVVINRVDDITFDALHLMSGISIIFNSDNVGLATALNQGIEYAFNELHVSYVNLYDQDSIPEQLLPLNLAIEINARRAVDSACIGPLLVDIKNPLLKYDNNDIQNRDDRALTIPTSGTLIPKKVWIKVGPMLDSLFIDCIDHEWCFRARSFGCEIYISRSLNMMHNMGDDFINYFGKYKPVHKSPMRHYYIIRNSLYLFSLKYIPISWRMVELIKTLRRIIFYLMVSSKKTKSAFLIIVAIKDGLIKSLGKKY